MLTLKDKFVISLLNSDIAGLKHVCEGGFDINTPFQAEQNALVFASINNKLDLIIAQGFNTIYFENDLLVGNKNFSIINIIEK